MGTHAIKMPDIGEGIAEVELVEWHVQVGDSVEEDQVLADVMTDKANVEIPSPVAGKVVGLDAEPGQVLAVGTVLIRLEVDGDGNVRGEVAKAQATPQPPTKAAWIPQQPAASAAIEKPPTGRPGPAQACAIAPSKALAAPAVRKRAADAGVELGDIQGTGPDGRVSHADLDAWLGQQAAGARSDVEQRIPVIGLRRKIAERMQEATRRAAHFSYVEAVDVTELEALRKALNQEWGQQRGHLTLLPLLARALVLALREFPQLNAHYDDEGQTIVRHSAVHLGIATQGDHGLLVPVLKHAQAGDLWDNARAIARLAEDARNGKAPRDVLSGSTITLTSLGALGGLVSTPVLNLPEVAIIGVNRIDEQPRVVDGQVVVRKVMNLSSSFDHRVVDGMDAARFIQAVKHWLERPGLLLVA